MSTKQKSMALLATLAVAAALVLTSGVAHSFVVALVFAMQVLTWVLLPLVLIGMLEKPGTVCKRAPLARFASMLISVTALLHTGHPWLAASVAASYLAHFGIERIERELVKNGR